MLISCWELSKLMRLHYKMVLIPPLNKSFPEAAVASLAKEEEKDRAHLLLELFLCIRIA